MKSIEVNFYSGGGRDEKPRSIQVEGKLLPIAKIISEAKVGSPLPEVGYHRIFVVETEDGRVWEIREAPQTDSGWEVEHKLQDSS
jgi:hypothetical protein